MVTSNQERLLDLIRSAGVFRSRDLEDQGFTREHLRRLRARGLVVAIEALRDSVEKRLASFDDLWKYARICRVSNVMRPFLESVG